MKLSEEVFCFYFWGGEMVMKCYQWGISVFAKFFRLRDWKDGIQCIYYNQINLDIVLLDRILGWSFCEFCVCGVFCGLVFGFC